MVDLKTLKFTTTQWERPRVGKRLKILEWEGEREKKTEYFISLEAKRGEKRGHKAPFTHLVSLNIRGSVTPGFVIASEIP